MRTLVADAAHDARGYADDAAAACASHLRRIRRRGDLSQMRLPSSAAAQKEAPAQ